MDIMTAHTVTYVDAVSAVRATLLDRNRFASMTEEQRADTTAKAVLAEWIQTAVLPAARAADALDRDLGCDPRPSLTDIVEDAVTKSRYGVEPSVWALFYEVSMRYSMAHHDAVMPAPGEIAAAIDAEIARTRREMPERFADQTGPE